MELSRSKEIEEFVNAKKVVIYMKGSPEFPQCGFSHKAIQIFQALEVKPEDIGAFDVLSDEEIRSQIKKYTNWNTIPQIFVKGKFVGGSDTLFEMYENGDLKKMLD